MHLLFLVCDVCVDSSLLLFTQHTAVRMQTLDFVDQDQQFSVLVVESYCYP